VPSSLQQHLLLVPVHGFNGYLAVLQFRFMGLTIYLVHAPTLRGCACLLTAVTRFFIAGGCAQPALQVVQLPERPAFLEISYSRMTLLLFIAAASLLLQVAVHNVPFKWCNHVSSVCLLPTHI
jgi:hypothetical protein